MWASVYDLRDILVNKGFRVDDADYKIHPSQLAVHAQLQRLEFAASGTLDF